MNESTKSSAKAGWILKAVLGGVSFVAVLAASAAAWLAYEVQNLQDDISSLSGELSSVNSDVADQATSLAMLSVETQSLQDEDDALSGRLANLNSDVRSLSASSSTNADEIENLRIQIYSLSGDVFAEPYSYFDNDSIEERIEDLERCHDALEFVVENPWWPQSPGSCLGY